MAMASEVTQAHVAAKLSQPSLGLTGKAVRAASPRPGLAKDPAARWGSRFPALQAAHAHCSGSPPPLGVRDCGSPRATLRSRWVGPPDALLRGAVGIQLVWRVGRRDGSALRGLGLEQRPCGPKVLCPGGV